MKNVSVRWLIAILQLLLVSPALKLAFKWTI